VASNIQSADTLIIYRSKWILTRRSASTNSTPLHHSNRSEPQKPHFTCVSMMRSLVCLGKSSNKVIMHPGLAAHPWLACDKYLVSNHQQYKVCRNQHKQHHQHTHSDVHNLSTRTACHPIPQQAFTCVSMIWSKTAGMSGKK
jgi:hypothetical protein